MLIQSAMLIAGIGTLIQLFPSWRVGSGLPIVMGISFTFVSILCFIGTTYGYETIVGAVLVGGILEGTLGLFAKYWLKWISPIVAASVVTAIGFSLLSVGSASFGGGSGSANFGSVQNWIIGTVTLLSCILFNLFAKSYFKQLSVLDLWLDIFWRFVCIRWIFPHLQIRRLLHSHILCHLKWSLI